MTDYNPPGEGKVLEFTRTGHDAVGLRRDRPATPC